ncbi:MAG TPA: GNAT family protein [Longimicrobiales bacterium]
MLEGSLVRLEPMTSQHVDAMSAAGLAPELWEWTTTMLRSVEDVAKYVEDALALRAAGSAMPFVTVSKPEDRVVGSTRFANYDAANRRVEIGWTWIGPAWQRTGVNVEAKLLMLEHAFEMLACNRVEFKTDARNEKSRNALAGIGAQEEGTLRSHMVLWNGRLRDSVYYSVIREEWPAVRAHLRARVQRSQAR